MIPVGVFKGAFGHFQGGEGFIFCAGKTFGTQQYFGPGTEDTGLRSFPNDVILLFRFAQNDDLSRKILDFSLVKSDQEGWMVR